MKNIGLNAESFGKISQKKLESLQPIYRQSSVKIQSTVSFWIKYVRR